MSKLTQEQRLLNWLEKQKKSDENELKAQKESLISELKKIKKSDLFVEPKNLTIWERIKITLLGI